MSAPTHDVPEWLFRATQAAIFAAVDRRVDDLFDVLQQITDEGGAPALFGACCAWAMAAGKMTGIEAALASAGREDSFVGISASRGPKDAEEAAQLFAVRFVAAYANRDMPQAEALFYGPLEAGDLEAHLSGVVALLCLVGDSGRAKLAEREAKLARRAARPSRSRQRPRGGRR